MAMRRIALSGCDRIGRGTAPCIAARPSTPPKGTALSAPNRLTARLCVLAKPSLTAEARAVHVNEIG
ncbi:MAG: hypothetical protein AVDCRST_MAG15-2060 [uncultured Rubellimicrobium sp.]|uniref:Uncharacterized protein n=1 Tax=uncultured Rubellimicrobium sp. TaxID=543078 RepID=A0A6J4PK20_9RHOB|nr:MAG: hypothetical protein AVDCRST_MAG15-2060 [uncultured Rubellimicrobium sp.]